MNLVVGSGPAGVACASALLDAGRPVTMLDTGIRLEPEKRRHVETLAGLPRERWPADAVAAVKEGFRADRGGVPMKKVFGSDFPFRAPPAAAALDQNGTKALRSFARGGLSKAWGSTLLPFHASDFEGWPFTAEDFAPHYRAVMRYVPLSAVSDGLDALFPTHSAAPQDLRPSRMGDSVMRALSARREELARLGVTFGRARLAVDASSCVYCGMCLYGCPYGCIYSSERTLETLERRPGFTYVGGVVVRRATESGDGVRVEALDAESGAPREFAGTRAFLAAGALGTAQILAESLGRTEPIRLQSSQAFLIPVLRFRGEKNVHLDAAHTLAQVFILLHDPAIARHRVQLQVYTYSDLFPTVLHGTPLGPLFRLVPPFQRAMTDRLMVVQGLLHSGDSDAMTLRGAPGADGRMTFALEGAVSDATRARVRAVVKRIVSMRRALGGFTAGPLLKMSLPGQSFHSGGTFPMSRTPGPSDSDLLGRPAGLSRIHAVDSTVLPTIPAPPLTLTSMANAHRIAGLVRD